MALAQRLGEDLRYDGGYNEKTQEDKEKRGGELRYKPLKLIFFSVLPYFLFE